MKNKIFIAFSLLTLIVLATSCASQKYDCPGNPQASSKFRGWFIVYRLSSWTITVLCFLWIVYSWNLNCTQLSISCCFNLFWMGPLGSDLRNFVSQGHFWYVFTRFRHITDPTHSAVSTGRAAPDLLHASILSAEYTREIVVGVS